MPRIQEIREQANTLDDRERAILAVELLESLPPVLDEDDGGLAEARRRDHDLDENPSHAISWEQLLSGLDR